MTFSEDSLYHIFNRGINSQMVFFSEEDYLDFLERLRMHLYPSCDILAWCLMPNHFHMMVHTNEHSLVLRKVGGNIMPELTYGIKQLLSSYAKSLNRKMKRTGNLFQQKTHAKPAEDALTVFHYIHQNPWRAGLVSRIEDWKFSSFPDYFGIRNDSLVNKSLAAALLDIEQNHLAFETYQRIPADLIAKLGKWR